jgi:hypothetical protein
MSKEKQGLSIIRPLPAVERTAEGLRDALFDELNLLRSGEATTSHARALANIARLVLESARLEIQEIKMMQETGKSLRLGKGDGTQETP